MRVLVVEDNRELVLSVKKGLEQENISVDVAYDASQEKRRPSSIHTMGYY